MGVPGLQWSHFPDSGAARDYRENDSPSLGRPLRTVQEGRIRSEESARRAGSDIDGKNGRPTRAVGGHCELVSIGRPRRTAERNRIGQDSSEARAIWMDHVHGRAVIRGLSREENGSAIRGPIWPREELGKRRGELPRHASDAIEDVEFAAVIEFAYEGDRAGIRRPGGQAT